MRPTFANLVAAKSGRLETTLQTPNVGGGGLTASRASVRLTGGGGLSLDLGDGDPPGMWVYYLPTRATYGLAEGGETWSASGPFSGCQIVVGKKAGRVYVAHLSQESGSSANDDWKGRGWSGEETWGRWKVPAPSSTVYSGSVVFVDWSKGTRASDISVVRVDVATDSMGGMKGKILDVVHLVNPE